MAVFPRRLTLTVFQGKDGLISVPLFEDAAQLIPANLTGFAGRLQFRPTVADEDVTAPLIEGTVTVVTVLPGVIELGWTNLQSQAIVLPRGVWEAEGFNGVIVESWALGDWVLKREVHR